MVGEGRLPPSSPLVSSVAIHLFVLYILALSHNVHVLSASLISLSLAGKWSRSHLTVVTEVGWQTTSFSQILLYASIQRVTGLLWGTNSGFLQGDKHL